MFGLLFVLLMLALCVCGYFWVKRLKRQKVEEFERLKRVAEGASLPNAFKSGAAAADTTSGGSVTVENGDGSVAATRKPKLLMSAEEGARLVATLREQMQAVLIAWRTTDEDWRQCERVASDAETADRVSNFQTWSNPDDLASIKSNLDRFREAWQRQRTTRAQARDMLASVPELLRPLEAPLNDLGRSVKRLRSSEDAPEQFPPGVHTVVVAACNFHDHVKWRHDDWLKTAAKAAKEAPKPRPKGPAKERYEGQVASLSDKLDAAVAAYAEFSKTRQEAVSTEESLKRHTNRNDFRQPQRPTQEEVGQYLKEIEIWAASGLERQRALAPLVVAFDSTYERFQQATDALKEAIGDVAQLAGKEIDADADALMRAATFFHATPVAELRRWGLRDMPDVHAAKTLEHPSVPVLSAGEVPEVNNLRKMMRTVAFALSQQNVAGAKHSAEKGKPALTGASLPNCNTTIEVDAYVSDYERYLTQHEEYSALGEQRAAAIAVAQANWEARRDKTKSAAVALGKRAELVSSSLLAGSADELRLVTLAAEKLAAMMK